MSSHFLPSTFPRFLPNQTHYFWASTLLFSQCFNRVLIWEERKLALIALPLLPHWRFSLYYWWVRCSPYSARMWMTTASLIIPSFFRCSHNSFMVRFPIWLQFWVWSFRNAPVSALRICEFSVWFLKKRRKLLILGFG